MQYTTDGKVVWIRHVLFYQDFKDTFVCNTQHFTRSAKKSRGCFIRISKILLYAIHNCWARTCLLVSVVLSGFQRYFCMQYTTINKYLKMAVKLFYQDFKDTFVCNTQHLVLSHKSHECCFIRISKILLYAIHNRAAYRTNPRGVVLSGFQRYFCMQYTTNHWCSLYAT